MIKERGEEGGTYGFRVRVPHVQVLSLLVSLSEIGTSLSPEGYYLLPSLPSALRMASGDETSGLLGRGWPTPNLEVKKKDMPSPVVKKQNRKDRWVNAFVYARGVTWVEERERGGKGWNEPATKRECLLFVPCSLSAKNAPCMTCTNLCEMARPSPAPPSCFV